MALASSPRVVGFPRRYGRPFSGRSDPRRPVSVGGISPGGVSLRRFSVPRPMS